MEKGNEKEARIKFCLKDNNLLKDKSSSNISEKIRLK